MAEGTISIRDKLKPAQRLAVNADGSINISPANGGSGSGRTPLSQTNTGANAQITATLTPGATVTAHINGFAVTGLGATGGASVQVAVSGLLGGTLNFTFPVPAGATVGCAALVITGIDWAASAVNTPIVVTVPAFGAGNTVATVSAWGYSA